MKDGFVRVSAVTPELKVADVEYNTGVICSYIDEAAASGSKLLVFPELCLTGYTCQDLFLQDRLLEDAAQALQTVTAHTRTYDCLVAVGLPMQIYGKLYNVAAVIQRGTVLGIIPKIHLPNYNEFYEARHFRSGAGLHTAISIAGNDVPVDSKLIFCCRDMPSLRVSFELCEDLWVPAPPSVSHCMAGATVIGNLSASDEIVGKSRYRRDLVAGQSARLICGYIYASAGNGESTQDVVYSGHNIIAENGTVLASSELFSKGITSTELDVTKIDADRRRMTTYGNTDETGYRTVPFSLELTDTVLTRHVSPRPFVPSDEQGRNERCEEILSIQAHGLRKRLEHIGCQKAVIGISGGLDSTLALLVTVRAFDLLELDHSGIVAVTMPGFGTTDRTYSNSVNLIRSLGATFREVNIAGAVTRHFADIGHDPSVHDVTYENSQARERTQILMDIANQQRGIVIGTGDLSELALGWATYNGDHMSMYAVNVSVPKTLVRHLVRYYADICGNEGLSRILQDVLDTPVSPELLPPENGVISQVTEDLVGPYELHDFFLYHMLRCGSNPDKIYRLARYAFTDAYAPAEILRWEKVFYSRFFAQHFKRSCLPDGPKVGSVAISPRGDLRMPTDASSRSWLRVLDDIDAGNSRD